MLQGDASDPGWCRDVLGPKSASYPSLDFVVCNAAPPIRPLGLSLDDVNRFRAFADQTLGLVVAPLATLLVPLAKRSGWAVVVSSSFVQAPPIELPHYVAAKWAAEGVAHWAAATYGDIHVLIVRPPKLLTDQTNTPAGRADAIGAERVAAAIVGRLLSPRPPRA